jgi:hypothetical protein
MPEKVREGGCDGRLADDIIDADANRREEISKAAREHLKKLHLEPIVTGS